MNLLLGLLFLGVVGLQWLTQEVMIKLFGVSVGIHRDEWPAFYWIVLLLEGGFGLLLIYWYFT